MTGASRYYNYSPQWGPLPYTNYVACFMSLVIRFNAVYVFSESLIQYLILQKPGQDHPESVPTSKHLVPRTSFTLQ